MLINDRYDAKPLMPWETIMFALLEWLFDISLAIGSAAATGSIFLLLLELGKVSYKHLAQNGRLKAAWRFNANATS
ncbi:hypothetical protein [Paraburkholderia sp. BCC1885]|uniref:hypothetical protein n=1 Tax=Paraburkholderia sp. BCC1885 TaxID=2562669 RepID=UPI0011826E22|nr:hypothetical protein [Paraburkholderia sp. BCC1885]